MEVILVKLKKRTMSDLLMKLEGVKIILNQKIEMAIHFLYQKGDNKYVNLKKKQMNEQMIKNFLLELSIKF